MRLAEEQPLKFNKSGLDGPMMCHRCEGTMIHEKFYGHQENFWGWRCIICGDIVDRTVLENRSSMAVGALRR
jgi:hypothetical protein